MGAIPFKKMGGGGQECTDLNLLIHVEGNTINEQKSRWLPFAE